MAMDQQASNAMKTTSINVPDSLTRIKDYIRWGASQFSLAGLCYGHGTVTAMDEAAALVLHGIHQPYNLSSDYLDAVLTITEREHIVQLFERRLKEKIPSAYITHEAMFAGLSFYVDDRVLVPRSPIAQLISEQFSPWVDAEQVTRVLDLCTGSACIAIACAYAFPDAQVDAVELSAQAIEVAKINCEKHQLCDRVHLLQADLFTGMKQTKYDLIVSNPPYVSLQEWAALPAEFHAEPAMGFKGGVSGLDLVIKILAQARDYLTAAGILVVEVGSSAETLQQQFPGVPFYWLEFEAGGDGVFLLTAEQLTEFDHLFRKI
jgi:ribosomal protein L3 glutamine methyltransferase